MYLYLDTYFFRTVCILKYLYLDTFFLRVSFNVSVSRYFFLGVSFNVFVSRYFFEKVSDLYTF